VQNDLFTGLSEGTILDGRFEIKRFLGKGSFGEVYQARQVVFGHVFRDVALKLFKTDSVNRENVADILNDAIALIRLMEENPPAEVDKRIVKVNDIGIINEPEPRAFMSMQLVGGRRTLQKEIRRHKVDGMPVELSLWYLTRILIPLAWMHEHEIVHGDIKPDNVLLREDSDIVLTDFGLAARLPIGVMGGAILHQAPEVLAGQIGTTQADVYSLGVMWYEMLTGQSPFGNVGLEENGRGDMKGFIKAQLAARKWPIRNSDTGIPAEKEQRIQPASEINAELLEFPQVESLLNNCFCYKISERFSNAGMLLSEIRNYKASGKISEWIVDNQTENVTEDTDGLPGKSPELLVADALTLSAQGHHQRSLNLLSSILTRDGSFVPAILAQARVFTAEEKIPEAMKRIEKVMRLTAKNPDPEAYDTLAFIYRSTGKVDMAAQMQKLAAKIRAES
jgi:serine/threonine protein kinase